MSHLDTSDLLIPALPSMTSAVTGVLYLRGAVTEKYRNVLCFLYKPEKFST